MKWVVLLLMVSMSYDAYAWDKQLHCLATNIYFEARGEPEEGQIAVAMVTMHRVFDSRFPKTICSVVWSYKQFSWTWQLKDYTIRDKEAWATAMRIAQGVKWLGDMYGSKMGGADRVRGSTHYINRHIRWPDWTVGATVVAQIGNHVFLRLRNEKIQTIYNYRSLL